jgi:DNA-binding NarL/FixJ family response regulator
MHDEVLYAERALRAGARGYVMKREALDNILTAMRTILQGEIYISPIMSKRMIFEHINGPGETSAVDRLTDRELEILELIGAGHEVRAIADTLHLSSKTVEAHRAHIKEKLNLKNAREVGRFATNWVNQQR